MFKKSFKKRSLSLFMALIMALSFAPSWGDNAFGRLFTSVVYAGEGDGDGTNPETGENTPKNPDGGGGPSTYDEDTGEVVTGSTTNKRTNPWGYTTVGYVATWNFPVSQNGGNTVLSDKFTFTGNQTYESYSVPMGLSENAVKTASSASQSGFGTQTLTVNWLNSVTNEILWVYNNSGNGGNTLSTDGKPMVMSASAARELSAFKAGIVDKPYGDFRLDPVTKLCEYAEIGTNADGSKQYSPSPIRIYGQVSTYNEFTTSADNIYYRKSTIDPNGRTTDVTDQYTTGLLVGSNMTTLELHKNESANVNSSLVMNYTGNNKLAKSFSGAYSTALSQLNSDTDRQKAYGIGTAKIQIGDNKVTLTSKMFLDQRVYSKDLPQAKVGDGTFVIPCIGTVNGYNVSQGVINNSVTKVQWGTKTTFDLIGSQNARVIVAPAPMDLKISARSTATGGTVVTGDQTIAGASLPLVVNPTTKQTTVYLKVDCANVNYDTITDIQFYKNKPLEGEPLNIAAVANRPTLDSYKNEFIKHGLQRPDVRENYSANSQVAVALPMAKVHTYPTSQQTVTGPYSTSTYIAYTIDVPADAKTVWAVVNPKGTDTYPREGYDHSGNFQGIKMKPDGSAPLQITPTELDPVVGLMQNNTIKFAVDAGPDLEIKVTNAPAGLMQASANVTTGATNPITINANVTAFKVPDLTVVTNPTTGATTQTGQKVEVRCYVDGVLADSKMLQLNKLPAVDTPVSFSIPSTKLPPFNGLPATIDVWVNEDNDDIFQTNNAGDVTAPIIEENMENNADSFLLVGSKGLDLSISMPASITAVRNTTVNITASVGWKDVQNLPVETTVTVGGQDQPLYIDTPNGSKNFSYSILITNQSKIVGYVNINNEDTDPEEADMTNNSAETKVTITEPTDKKDEYIVRIKDRYGNELPVTKPADWTWTGSADYYMTLAYHPQWLSEFFRNMLGKNHTLDKIFELGGLYGSLNAQRSNIQAMYPGQSWSSKPTAAEWTKLIDNINKNRQLKVEVEWNVDQWVTTNGHTWDEWESCSNPDHTGHWQRTGKSDCVIGLPTINTSTATSANTLTGPVADKWTYSLADGTNAEIPIRQETKDINGNIGAMNPNGGKKLATFDGGNQYFTIPAWCSMLAVNKTDNGYVVVFSIKVDGTGVFDVNEHCNENNSSKHGFSCSNGGHHQYKVPFSKTKKVAVFIPSTKIYPQNLDVSTGGATK